MIGFSREERLTFSPLPRSPDMFVTWSLEYVHDVANSCKRDNPSDITTWVEESLNLNATESLLMNSHPFESMDSKIRQRIGGEAMDLLQKAKEGASTPQGMCALLAKLAPLCHRMQVGVCAQG